MEHQQQNHKPPSGISTSPAVPLSIECKLNQTVALQKTSHVSTAILYGVPIVSLYIEGQERLCLAQISNTLLKQFSYNEIHNRRVALGITCVQCTPVQLEMLRRAGAMPVSSRRCGMITRREAERLCKSFLGDNAPPRLPDDFAFNVQHKCAWGCRGSFIPSRYNSSRAKCIKCSFCGIFFSPNKFIFHSHRLNPADKYIQPDAANFNSWRRHMVLSGQPPEEITHAWEDVKAMFNGGTRKRLMSSSSKTSISPGVIVSNQMTSSEGSGTVFSTPQSCDDVHPHSTLPKRPKDHKIDCVRTESSSALVGVAAVAAASLNLNQSSSSMAVIAQRTDQKTQPIFTDHEMPAVVRPLASSFMMDYMWHAHIQQQHQQKTKSSSMNPGMLFPAVNTFPWIKTGNVATLANEPSRTPSSVTSLCHPIDIRQQQKDSPKHADDLKDGKSIILPQLLTASAFKPIPAKPSATAAAATVAISSQSQDSQSIICSLTDSDRSIRSSSTVSLTAHRDLDLANASALSYVTSQHPRALPLISVEKSDGYIHKDASEGGSHLAVDDSDDDEVVDIETTENEVEDNLASCSFLCNAGVVDNIDVDGIEEQAVIRDNVSSPATSDLKENYESSDENYISCSAPPLALGTISANCSPLINSKTVFWKELLDTEDEWMDKEKQKLECSQNGEKPLVTETKPSNLVRDAVENLPQTVMKKSMSSSNGTVLLETLQCYHRNKIISTNNNNNKSHDDTYQNVSTNEDNREFWHVASRLSMQRPLYYDELAINWRYHHTLPIYYKQHE